MSCVLCGDTLGAGDVAVDLLRAVVDGDAWQWIAAPTSQFALLVPPRAREISFVRGKGHASCVVGYTASLRRGSTG